MSAYRDFTELRYHDHVDRVARRLHELADEVQREGDRTDPKIDVPGFGWAASQVIHAVSWGLANLNRDALVLAAAEADRPALGSLPAEENPK